MIAKRYITILNSILIVLLIGAGIYFFWEIYSAPGRDQDLSGGDRKIDAIVAPTPPSADSYRVIVSRDLWKEKFKAPEEAPPPTPIPPKIPPPRLKLLGTSIREDQSRTSAFIEVVTTRKQGIYRIGDMVADAEVLEIHRNRVLLNHRGNIFQITSFANSIQVSESRVPLDRILRQTGENTWLVSKKGLWKYIGVNIDRNDRLKIMTLLPKIMGALVTVGCRPYYPPGKPKRGPSEGYEIVVLRKNHLAYHLGIRQGDIIVAVNDQPITGKQNALNIFQEVQSAEKVIVGIIREEKELKLTYIVQFELLEPEGS